MADSSTILVIDQTDALNKESRESKELLKRIINHLEGYLVGARRGNSIQVFDDGADPAQASGTVTLSSASGAITITINGVTAASETWATSDAATATALAADINASTDALVQHFVTASAAAGVVTITATQKSKWGNAITLAASGTGTTASGARLTGGLGGNVAVTTITL